MHLFPNGKKYIGITKLKVEARWGNNGSGYVGQKVYSAIVEYGWDNIEHIILFDNLTKEEAQNKEIELIKKYDSINNGYNVHTGGDVGWIKKDDRLIEYDGQLYTIDDLVNISTVDNITRKDIITRLSRGWDIDRILTQEKYSKNTKYEYDGHYYTSAQLAKISTVDGIKTSHIIERLKNGFSVERAITQPLNVKCQPTHIGEIMYYYKDKEHTLNELSKINSSLNLSPKDIQARIKRGWDIEKAISQPLRRSSIKYNYNGVEYTSVELSKLSPIHNSARIIRERLESGWSVDDALNVPPKENNKKYEYDGQLYSLSDLIPLCTFDNPSKSLLYDRLNCLNWDVKKAITVPICGNYTMYKYNDKYYTVYDLLEFCNNKNITYNILEYRLETLHWNVEKSLQT